VYPMASFGQARMALHTLGSAEHWSLFTNGFIPRSLSSAPLIVQDRDPHYSGMPIRHHQS
jgi:hypothetical protein